MDITTRWLMNQDFSKVVQIDSESHPDPWSKDDIVEHLCQRSVIGMSVLAGETVVGFMTYTIFRHSFHVNRMAVALGVRRRGVGTVMVGRLREKLSQQRRRSIVTIVRESNLAGQLFLQRQGFWATGTTDDEFDDELGYIMRYDVCDDDPVASRIAKYFSHT